MYINVKNGVALQGTFCACKVRWSSSDHPATCVTTGHGSLREEW